MKTTKDHFKLLPWLSVAALGVLVTACGGGGGGDPVWGSDNSAPVVTVVSPLPDATGVFQNTKVITAAFSKAMNPATLTPTSFTLACPPYAPIGGGTVTYLPLRKVAVLSLPAALPAGPCSATLSTSVKDSMGIALTSHYTWQFTTIAVYDLTAPTFTVSPLDAALNVATNTSVKAFFNEAMNPLTLHTSSFKLVDNNGVPIAGLVSLGPLNKTATFKPSNPLAVNTTYTATVTTEATDAAGNALAVNKTWTFTTSATASVTAGIDLDTAATFGTFGGMAGMTNTGIQTVVNGDIGTIATSTTSITGFHEVLPPNDRYTETLANIGAVNGTIYTCTNPTGGFVSAPSCAVATQARLDAETAYLALVAMPVGGASPAPGANLAGVTLLPGTYKAAGGSYMIQGADLTLDAQGDANATWVFQMATTLTVGGPGASAPQSVILTNGAQAKNVFWQVGSFATVNAGGGGTLKGTLITQAGASFSTVGNTLPVTLDGRVLSLGASVTLVDTFINVPSP